MTTQANNLIQQQDVNIPESLQRYMTIHDEYENLDLVVMMSKHPRQNINNSVLQHANVGCRTLRVSVELILTAAPGFQQRLDADLEKA